MMKELTIKNTIDQAEKELYEVLWKNLQPLRLGDNTIAHIQKPLEMYISTYTKDLLQSVVGELTEKIEMVFHPLAKDIKKQEILDIIKEIK